MRPTVAVINLSNLKRNFLNIRKKVGSTKIMAVVKANAYGHGVKEIVSALNSLENKKPEYYAVAICDEAIELRKIKVKQPILVFEPFEKDEAGEIFKYDLIPTVFEDRHLNILLKAQKKYNRKNINNKKIKIHIKVDTGMNRLGIRYEDSFKFIEKISRNKNFLIDGIYTHFATSDEIDKEFANFQLKKFGNLLNQLTAQNIKYGLAHAANSGAILDMPDSYFDMVRPGMILYGYYPSTETTESFPVFPVMSLTSIVSSIKEIYPDETVGYGRIFTATKKTKIASVPIGYADGFSRNLSNNTKAIINGKMYKEVGRVSMDRITFDVGLDDVKVGDKVTLIGKDKDFEISAWDWCKILDTIPYEIICGISSRVPRIYKN